jgi:hypothetical protein
MPDTNIVLCRLERNTSRTALLVLAGPQLPCQVPAGLISNDKLLLQAIYSHPCYTPSKTHGACSLEFLCRLELPASCGLNAIQNVACTQYKGVRSEDLFPYVYDVHILSENTGQPCRSRLFVVRTSQRSRDQASASFRKRKAQLPYGRTHQDPGSFILTGETRSPWMWSYNYPCKVQANAATPFDHTHYSDARACTSVTNQVSGQ